MSAKADWIVVAGFLLVVLGASLRIFIMMRSTDTRPVNALPILALSCAPTAQHSPTAGCR
jgi:uncharacterized membrane protein